MKDYGRTFPTGAAAGKVLTSDADGNATWEAGGSSVVLAANTFTGTQEMPAIKITTGAGARKALVSDADGNATWNTIEISNIVEATTSTTLTSISTLLSITPTGYGVIVTLPDATTCSERGSVHIIDNKSAYDIKIVDSAATIKGFIRPYSACTVSLIDNASAAGTWSLDNAQPLGRTAQKNLLTIKFMSKKSIMLDSDREVLFYYGVSDYLYGIVYNKTTNTFGSQTAIRSTAVQDKYSAIKCATDQILVVSCTTGSTAFEAVVLSISGTTITPNAAATKTLSANIAAFTETPGGGLIQVGASFITAYTVSTPACQIREITISGTTPTVSNATVLTGTAGGLIVAGSATVVIAVSTLTTHLYTEVFSIAGLAGGTGTDTNSGTMTLNRLFALGTRWGVIYNDGGTTVKGGVISLSSTTTTITTVTLFSASQILGAVLISSSNVCVTNAAATSNCNILTDTAGTASAGTAITLSDETTHYPLYVTGTDIVAVSGTTDYCQYLIDCSGASPVLSKRVKVDSVSSSDIAAQNTSILSGLEKSSSSIFGAGFVFPLNFRTHVWMIQNDQPFIVSNPFLYTNSVAFGVNDSIRWCYYGGSTGIQDAIVRVECIP